MKGFMHTIEAAIAGIILISFLAYLSVGTLGDLQGPGLRGYDALENLDNQGLLRNLVMEGDYSGINDLILVPGYNHTIELCDSFGDCLGTKPESDNVWVANYIISGKHGYSPYNIKLYMWLE